MHHHPTVALRVVDGATNPTFWLLNDQLGSTAITADASGALSAELRFKAWGEQRYASGTTPTTYRYTGQREQSQLSIYFYGARWYDPQLSRFLQADTIVPGASNPQAWDRFAYALNSPIMLIDPSGHSVGSPTYNYDPDFMFSQKYGIKITGNFYKDEKRTKRLMAVIEAVKVTSAKLARYSEKPAFETFRKSFGQITIAFEGDSSNCGVNGSKITCGYGNADDARLDVHELGHIFGNKSGGREDLGRAAKTDFNGNWVMGSRDGAYERTTRGFLGEKAPYLYHGKQFSDWNSNENNTARNEDYADTFMNWVFGSFDQNSNGAGAIRSDWMTTNVAAWVSQSTR